MKKNKQLAVFSLQFSVLAIALLIGASFPLQVGSAQFIDRITRPCSSGLTSRALVVTNPNNTGNVEITTCTGGSVTINGAAVVPGGATINPTNTFIPYRSNATTFLDSPLARTSATVITSTAAFNGPVGGVNTATYSFAAEPTLGWIRGAAGQLTATSAGTIGWFDTNGWHGFGTKVEVFNDTATSTDGFIATTNGNATVGVQKLSPRIRLSGSGWKTDAVAGAQMTDWIIENQPVQGAANPSTNLVFSSQVNAGGYTPSVTFTSAGNVGIGIAAPGFSLEVNGRIGINGMPVIYLPNQASFPNTLVIGNGGANLLHTGGSEGYYNTYVGILAGVQNTTGLANTGIGMGALNALTTGAYNTVVGSSAGFALTTACCNTVIGESALGALQTGDGNTALGTDTLRTANGGSYNTAVGDGALYFLTVGIYNEGVGTAALLNLTTGSFNAAFGSGALASVTTTNNNTAVGRHAAVLATGSNNLALGFEAAANLTTGSNNITIGAGVNAVSATANNQLNIGNTIYGDISTAKIGIGITVPVQKLEVLGTNQTPATNGSAADGAIRISGGTDLIMDLGTYGGFGGWIQPRNKTNYTANYTLALNPNGGNVGIGTLAGLSTLSINGGLHVGGDSNAGDNNLLVDGSTASAIYATTTNCADSAGAAACGAAAAGAVVIDAGSTNVVVSTTAVTATSRVMVVFDSSLGTELGVTCNTTAALPFVTARTAATSFTITVGVAPAVNPGCFTYWIVN